LQGWFWNVKNAAQLWDFSATIYYCGNATIQILSRILFSFNWILNENKRKSKLLLKQKRLVFFFRR
jgi:predicted Zn-dependent protease